MNDKRKEALKAKIKVLREQLNEIESKESEAECRALIGTCYVGKNDGGGEGWPVYVSVIGYEGHLKVARFEIRPARNGLKRFFLEFDDEYTPNFSDRGYTVMTREEFEKAWDEFKLAMCSAKVTA
jgi:hypothetical protein